jgi:hypothetical protein
MVGEVVEAGETSEAWEACGEHAIARTATTASRPLMPVERNHQPPVTDQNPCCDANDSVRGM